MVWICYVQVKAFFSCKSTLKCNTSMRPCKLNAKKMQPLDQWHQEEHSISEALEIIDLSMQEFLTCQSRNSWLVNPEIPDLSIWKSGFLKLQRPALTTTESWNVQNIKYDNYKQMKTTAITTKAEPWRPQWKSPMGEQKALVSGTWIKLHLNSKKTSSQPITIAIIVITFECIYVITKCSMSSFGYSG